MTPVVAGSLTAISWGSADFIARYTGRALGVVTALFWMLATSAVILTGTAWMAGQLPSGLLDATGERWPALTLLVFYGVGMTLGTLLLYHALARGPVSVAAPIVGSFPAFNLLVAILLGTRPSALQWIAMAGVMAGVAMVARLAEPLENTKATGTSHRRHTVLVSLASAAAFGLSISAGQAAGAVFGDLQTVCAGRWIGVIACAALLVTQRHRVGIPWRWWPVVTVQGALDGAAYVTLLLGSAGAASPIAPMIGSTFSVVTVALARLVLREPIGRGQWLGIALVVAGVVGLSAA